MPEVITYTLVELLIFYAAYTYLFGVKFTKKKLLYVAVILGTCCVQAAVLYLVDDSWVDVVIIGGGFFAAPILARENRFKAFLLFPIVYFLASMGNILSAYGLEALLGINHGAFCDSIGLMLVAESVTLFSFTVCGMVIKKRNSAEVAFNVRQYFTLFLGICCAVVIVGFSQGLLAGDPLVNELKNQVAVACVVIALLFVALSIWQQVTWKKAYKYKIENEKYELFLSKQEEHIRILISEDEKRRRLKHDMRAHVQALDALAKDGELDLLRQYLHNMEKSLSNDKIEQFTTISAVDAVISEWYKEAAKRQAEWSWEGELSPPERITIFELCTIFSNLLENAVEAIENVHEKRQIKINISIFQGKIVIVIGNSCDTAIKANSRPATTKEDKTNHGLGLKNVEEIVRKHKGSVEYEMYNGWFQITVIL